MLDSRIVSYIATPTKHTCSHIIPTTECAKSGFAQHFLVWVIMFQLYRLGTPAFQREPLMSWNLGPAYQIAEEWAKERVVDTGTKPMFDNLCGFHLPVGVRPSEELEDNANCSFTAPNLVPEIRDDLKALPTANSSTSWSALTDASFEAMRDFYNHTFTPPKGKYADVPKKQGVLSVRAASMLVICCP